MGEGYCKCRDQSQGRSESEGRQALGAITRIINARLCIHKVFVGSERASANRARSVDRPLRYSADGRADSYCNRIMDVEESGKCDDG